MANHDDGGPAFARPTGHDGSLDQTGMTLWDYFAGQALAGMLGRDDSIGEVVSKITYAGFAEAAATYADAMIAEKRRREPSARDVVEVDRQVLEQLLDQPIDAAWRVVNRLLGVDRG